MDQIRQIRYLVAPFFFFASLLWGYHLSPGNPKFDLDKLKDLAPLIAASFFPIGFLIGAISHFLVRIIFWIATGNRTEAVVMSRETLVRIWKKIGRADQPALGLEFFGSATFDHEILAERVHQWVMRQWTAFTISAHSCTALMIAFLIGPWINIQHTCKWGLTTLFACVVLLMNALVTWHLCSKMIDFQSSRPQTKEFSKSGSNENQVGGRGRYLKAKAYGETRRKIRWV